jgi:hypothetical protein
MNEAFEDDSGWPWYWKLLILFLLGGFFCAIAIPNFNGGGPSNLSYIISYLRQIDGAKNEWAYERGSTNESQVIQLTNQLTEKDLFEYIHHNPDKPNDLVPSVAGEIYTIGGFGVGPEARLTKKLKLRNESWPKGTIIRLGLDPDSGMPYQVIFPDGTKKHFEMIK